MFNAVECPKCGSPIPISDLRQKWFSANGDNVTFIATLADRIYVQCEACDATLESQHCYQAVPVQYHAQVSGNGVVAQGTGATAVGPGGVLIGGASRNNLIVTGSGQQVQGGSRPVDERQPLKPGDRIECPECEHVVTLIAATCGQFSTSRKGGQFGHYLKGKNRPFSCPNCGQPARETNSDAWHIKQSSTGGGAVAQGPGATAVASGAVHRVGDVYGTVAE